MGSIVVGLAFFVYVFTAFVLLLFAARVRQRNTGESLFWAASEVSWSFGSGLGRAGMYLRLWLLLGALAMCLVAVLARRLPP